MQTRLNLHGANRGGGLRGVQIQPSLHRKRLTLLAYFARFMSPEIPEIDFVWGLVESGVFLKIETDRFHAYR